MSYICLGWLRETVYFSWGEKFLMKAKVTLGELWQSFKSNLNYYNLFWIFFISSILGYAVEMVFCVLKNGVIQSRQGLLYGPFTQIYGIGAVLLVLLLKPLVEKRNSFAFLGGALVGGGFEYVASWAQQTFFHSNSWNYSNMWGNIGGRTSIGMMVLWGLLGLAFIKLVYPLLERFIHKIPKRIGVILTAIFTVLLAVDIFLSATAVHRWGDRVKGDPPGNSLDAFLDAHYDNDYMKKVYPNLKLHE